MASCIGGNPDVWLKIILESSNTADPVDSDSEEKTDDEKPFHLTQNVSRITNRKFCLNGNRPWTPVCALG